MRTGRPAGEPDGRGAGPREAGAATAYRRVIELVAIVGVVQVIELIRRERMLGSVAAARFGACGPLGSGQRSLLWMSPAHGSRSSLG